MVAWCLQGNGGRASGAGIIYKLLLKAPENMLRGTGLS